MKQVAKLVYVTLLTRVICDENATDEQIVSLAKDGFQAKLDNDEILEDIEKIVDDTECPFDPETDAPDPDGITNLHIVKANQIFSGGMLISERDAISRIISQAKKDRINVDHTLIDNFDDDIDIVHNRQYSLTANEFLDEIGYTLQD